MTAAAPGSAEAPGLDPAASPHARRRRRAFALLLLCCVAAGVVVVQVPNAPYSLLGLATLPAYVIFVHADVRAQGRDGWRAVRGLALALVPGIGLFLWLLRSRGPRGLLLGFAVQLGLSVAVGLGALFGLLLQGAVRVFGG